MNFDTLGCLPIGDYLLSLDQLRSSILVRGSQQHPLDTEWRLQLVDHLEVLARHLWTVGIEEIFVDGSFVTSKHRPNDIDGYYVCDAKDLASGSLYQVLNEVAEEDIWDMSHRVMVGGQLKPVMWKKYRCEFYPHCEEIHTNFPHPPFPQFFRQTRAGLGKGIVKLIRGDEHD